MARSFNGTTDNIDFGHISDSLIAQTGPISACIWIKINSDNITDSSYHSLFSYGNGRGEAAGIDLFNFELNSDASLTVNIKDGLATTNQVTLAATGDNGLHHLGMTFTTAPLLTGYLDGSAINTGNNGARGVATNETFTVRLGCGTKKSDGSKTEFSKLDLAAEAAIWTATLTAGEMAALAKGYSPLFIRPSALVEYWPLMRSPLSYMIGTTATITGTSIVPHPRIIMPRRGKIGHNSAGAAPPSFIAAWARSSNLPVLGSGVY